MRNAKRCFLAIGLIVLILCSCSKGSGKEEKVGGMQESVKQEEHYLEIDNISWGMTVDETLKACGVEKTDVSELTESTYATSFYIRDGRDVFGTKTESILFNFMDATLSGKEQKLCSIDIVYADNVNMGGVLEQMKSDFGETVSKTVQYDMSSMHSEIRYRVMNMKRMNGLLYGRAKQFQRLYLKRRHPNMKNCGRFR